MFWTPHRRPGLRVNRFQAHDLHQPLYVLAIDVELRRLRRLPNYGRFRYSLSIRHISFRFAAVSPASP